MGIDDIRRARDQYNIRAARRRYSMAHWGEGYFDIDDRGHVLALPDRDSGHGVDLRELADRIRQAGLRLPVLVRFTDILRDRVRVLCAAFREAMAQTGYPASYTAVYPVKVNQQRCVVEEIVRHGAGCVGLEAGSKPELAAVLGLAAPGSVVVCNGYKDREYIRRALIGRALGLRVFLVIEKLSELDIVLREAADLGVEPLLGIRLRLASISAGKWQNSGGEKAKFGLSAAQVLQAVERLGAAGRLSCLRLLHVHLGSQIANIRDIQRGMHEASRYYAELHRCGAPIGVVDVGGGLGVDYEGSRSRSDCSTNYGVAEYAHNVVQALWQVCQEHDLPVPDIFSESGRALTAHHAMLMVPVVAVERVPEVAGNHRPDADDPRVLHNLYQLLSEPERRAPLEVYHDAVHWLAEARNQYLHGVLDLARRAHAEEYYFAVCRRLLPLLSPASRAHREVVDELNEQLADKYFCNFSVFQSVPDVWAIDQVFPILPLHRHDEEPQRRAVLQDLTCDSDGRISRYVQEDGLDSTLPVHEWKPDEPYLLGIFMVGAYQEILGDMHNLFGDTDAVNVVLDGQGGYRLQEPERGDRAGELLRYVHFDIEGLGRAYRRRIGEAGLDGETARRYLDELQRGLTGYTYLAEG